METAAEVAALKDAGWDPRLISIVIGDTAAVEIYVRNQRRTAGKVGIAFDERNFPADVTEPEMIAAIQAMNADPRVTGIIIQRPVPPQINVKRLQSAIHPLKDVEGLHPTSIGNIVYNEIELGPCTAMASVHMLRNTGLSLSGLEVVVVGHSEIVGKPIAFLLMAEGATVTVCHHMTRNLAVHCRQADAVFVAVGRPGLVIGNMIKPGAAVIDIGINRVVEDDGTERTVGDCDFESCREIAGWITPVPGGVGPVTVAILMHNTVTGAKRQKEFYSSTFTADAWTTGPDAAASAWRQTS
ncbi:MAG: bifunctional 5,10-methylenetetrahydrofolate dehydrogenase/5,10-methenyltetrahydrofolate cyclohydrolase [Rhodospirillales bacterium]|nr:bifunctional 5,10-methylenetetrahydrofolate dehydrogenase/5,10-methenyltetrahydrofolate cyclohydrolase [Rhodospirillales bacterium]